jgi:hypothetical protein
MKIRPPPELINDEVSELKEPDPLPSVSDRKFSGPWVNRFTFPTWMSPRALKVTDLSEMDTFTFELMLMLPETEIEIVFATALACRSATFR